jgi:hypothetical protein
MSDDEIEDPAASTQMFQAFVDRAREPEATGSRWLWVALAVAVLALVLAVAWVVLSG